MSKVAVRFMRTCLRYNIGERAGFSAAVAEELVKTGKARYDQIPERGSRADDPGHRPVQSSARLLSDFDIRADILASLKKHGIGTMDDLLLTPYETLISIPRIGPATARKLMALIAGEA